MVARTGNCSLRVVKSGSLGHPSLYSEFESTLNSVRLYCQYEGGGGEVEEGKEEEEGNRDDNMALASAAAQLNIKVD